MLNYSLHIGPSTHRKYHVVLDTRDCFTCSFTEFLPFTPKLYYFSTFKDFKTLTPA